MTRKGRTLNSGKTFYETAASPKKTFFPIRYSAQVFIPLDDKLLEIIQNDKKQLTRIAETSLFKRLEQDTNNATSFIKANPLFSTLIRFADGGVYLTTETVEPEMLKYFKNLVCGELSLMLGNMRNCSKDDRRSYYVF